MANVRLDKVEKVYSEDIRVLHDLDLTILDGEFLVLVGPSGCGKSTILRIVAGLEEVTSGRVWIGDRDVTTMPPRDRDIAMVFQNYALYPHLTVFENLAFGLRIRRRPKPEIETKVRAAATLLAIEPLLDKQPRALSGGERQRVALGRALVRDPQVFLFDEPLSNLDAKLRSGMRAEISGLHRRLGVTSVYVTHDQVEAMTMGQRIVVLDGGRVQQIGAPLEVYNCPRNRFVAGFIGNPSMNFFPNSRSEGGSLDLGIGLGGLPAEDALPEGTFTLGIRPEHLRVDSDSKLRMRITLVEPTGGEAYVYGDVVAASPGDDEDQSGADVPTQVILRTSSETRIEIGDEVGFRFDLAHAHFFDSATDERINP